MMTKWNKMDTLDKTKEILIWFLIVVGIIGSLVGATELLPYAVLGIALKLGTMENNK